MVSINNTASNSFVLSSLRQTNKDITTAQTRIGTGFKINGASDGAALWATAQGIRSDIKSQNSLSSGISLAKAKVDAAVAGIDQITNLIGKINELAEKGVSGGTDNLGGSVTNQLASLKTQITAVIDGATIDGANYLKDVAVSSLDVKIGAGADAKLSVATDEIAKSGTDLDNFTAAVSSAANTDDLFKLVALAKKATTYIGDYQSTLSSFSSGLDSQADFLGKLDAIKSTALSAIVDTDMEAESAKITALQVKQQLAYQALAITNSTSQNILALFR